jgi:hypothetical protein
MRVQPAGLAFSQQVLSFIALASKRKLFHDAEAELDSIFPFHKLLHKG